MMTTLHIGRGKTSRLLQPVHRTINAIRDRLLGKKVSAYWFTGIVNFGDLLTPLILRHYGLAAVHHPAGRARVLAAGSILQHAPETYAGHIVGTGLVKDTPCPLPRARIWAVRGELTRDRVAAPRNTVLGDPGLLASKCVKRRRARRYALGIVPHHVDSNDPRISAIKNRHEQDVLVINVKRPPMAVLKDIQQCHRILSSSLHGVVVADSLNIPNAWMVLSDKVIGNGFKFRDYYSGLGTHRAPVRLDGSERISRLLEFAQRPPKAVEEVSERLDRTFRSLAKCLHSE